MTGSGTLVDPWDILSAILSAKIKPGHTLHLRGGGYVGDLTGVLLTGSAGRPVTVQPYRAERPVLDGSFYLRKTNVVMRGLEITDADFTQRVTADDGSSPPGLPLRDGMRLEAPGAGFQVVNCVIHDTRQGMLIDLAVPDAEVYGCVIYHNGWIGPTRGHGHGVYAGNSTATARKVTDCIIHSQFGYGLHFYATGLDWDTWILQNLHADGCILFRNGSSTNPAVNYGNLFGGSGPGTTVRASSLKDSCIYQDTLQIGGGVVTCSSLDFVLTGNVIVGNVTMLYHGARPTITGNKFYGNVAIKKGETGLLDDAANVYPDNEYHPGGVPDLVRVRPNAYQSGRANVAVFNGSLADNVKVGVAGVLGVGVSYTLRNAQDYFGDIAAGVVARDGTLTVDMRAGRHTVKAPQGREANPDMTTFPAFGAFVLEPA